MAEYIIIAILSLLSLVLFIINISQKEKIVKFVEDSQINFLKKLEIKIFTSREEQEKLYSEKRRKTKNKTLEYKIEQIINKILKELENEGINSVIHSYPTHTHTQYRNIEVAKLKYIFISYDSKEELYDSIVFDKNNFTIKYNTKINFDSLVEDFKEHWKDRTTIEQVIKNRIKKILAENLMDDLDVTNNDEQENVISGHNPMSQRSKISVYANRINFH